MVNSVAHESGPKRQRRGSRLGFEVRSRFARKKATSKVAFDLDPSRTRKEMKGKPAEKKGNPSDSFPATRSKAADPDVPSTDQETENQSNIITAECSLAIPRAVPVVASTVVNKASKPDPEPNSEEEESSTTSSPETAPQSPSSIIKMSRYQLCILLNKVVDVVAAAALDRSEDYDFSMLESLAPHLDKQVSDDDDGEDQITMTQNKLNMIVTSIVQGTKTSVANKTSLPSGIELPGMGPNGGIVHLSWPPDPPGEYHPEISST